MYANVKMLGISTQSGCLCGVENVSCELINDAKSLFLNEGGEGSRDGPIKCI